MCSLNCDACEYAWLAQMTTNYPTLLRVTEVHEPPLFGAAYAHVATVVPPNHERE